MSDRDSVLQEFMAISGVGDEARAKFYLEAANWELSLALSGFFEGGDSQVRVCVCVRLCVRECVCVCVREKLLLWIVLLMFVLTCL